MFSNQDIYPFSSLLWGTIPAGLHPQGCHGVQTKHYKAWTGRMYLVGPWWECRQRLGVAQLLTDGTPQSEARVVHWMLVKFGGRHWVVGE